METSQEKISKRISELIEANETTAYKLIKDIGVPRASFYKMIKNESEWKLDYITKIADYFGISLDYLVKGKDIKDDDEKKSLKLEEENRQLKEQNERLRAYIENAASLLSQVKEAEKKKRKPKR